MEQNNLVVLLWVKFCMNYSDIKGIIHYMCEKTGKEWLEEHLRNKFNNCYDQATCYGAMNLFYCDLDSDLREALVEYAITVWSPEAMRYSYNAELLDL